MSEEIIEEFDLSDEGEDEAKNFTPLADGVKPGLLLTVKQVTGISAPYVKNGTVYLPLGGGDVPLANFSWWMSSPIAGTLRAFNFENSTAVEVRNGHMYFPTAQYNASGIGDVIGALAGVKYSSSVDSPKIENGVLILPIPDSALKGLTASDGTQIAWNELNYGVGDASVLDSIMVGNQQVQLIASYNNGFLKIGFHY